MRIAAWMTQAGSLLDAGWKVKRRAESQPNGIGAILDRLESAATYVCGAALAFRIAGHLFVAFGGAKRCQRSQINRDGLHYHAIAKLKEGSQSCRYLLVGDHVAAADMRQSKLFSRLKVVDRHQDKSQALPIFDPELPTDSIHKNTHALRLAYIVRLAREVVRPNALPTRRRA